MSLFLAKILVILCVTTNKAKSIPPGECFEPFKWQDCGKSPVPVIYYLKAESRCEVGYWRGCEPNPNQFEDFVDCVLTCVFSTKVKDIDNHNKLGTDYGTKLYSDYEFDDEDIIADDKKGNEDGEGNTETTTDANGNGTANDTAHANGSDGNDANANGSTDANGSANGTDGSANASANETANGSANST